MTRLTIFILPIILLLATDARAEEIYLNCKWDYGRVIKEKGIFVERIIIKGEPRSIDTFIILDLKNKKVIQNSVISKIIFPDDIVVFWNYENKLSKFYYNYKLNRVSGLLEELYEDEKNNNRTITHYICDKTQKKF